MSGYGHGARTGAGQPEQFGAFMADSLSAFDAMMDAVKGNNTLQGINSTSATAGPLGGGGGGGGEHGGPGLSLGQSGMVGGYPQQQMGPGAVAIVGDEQMIGRVTSAYQHEYGTGIGHGSEYGMGMGMGGGGGAAVGSAFTPQTNQTSHVNVNVPVQVKSLQDEVRSLEIRNQQQMAALANIHAVPPSQTSQYAHQQTFPSHQHQYQNQPSPTGGGAWHGGVPPQQQQQQHQQPPQQPPHHQPPTPFTAGVGGIGAGQHSYSHSHAPSHAPSPVPSMAYSQNQQSPAVSPAPSPAPGGGGAYYADPRAWNGGPTPGSPGGASAHGHGHAPMEPPTPGSVNDVGMDVDWQGER